MMQKYVAKLPPVSQYTAPDGREIVCVPVILAIPVDPLDGHTREEAMQVAHDRLADLPLEVSCGGVPLAAHAAIPMASASTCAERDSR